MTVLIGRGRHRRPHRIPRALAAVLLVVLLTATPVASSRAAVGTQAAYSAIEER